jgi:rare lipoprotein A (peptidoglycan hydrolase)
MALCVECQEKNALRTADATARGGPHHAKTFSDRIVLAIVSLFYAAAAHSTHGTRRVSRDASAPFRFFAAPFAMALAGIAISTSSGCGHRPRNTSAHLPTPPQPASVGLTETGTASWYGHPYHGRPTASGEIYDMEKFTAAHRTLPFQTWLEVTNLSNGKHVEVRVTDRGPFVDGRILDLSHAAAQEIDMLRAGTTRVRLKVIAPPHRPAPPSPAAEPPDATPDPPPDPPRPTLSEQALLNMPLVPPPAVGHYSVQAGAFADRRRAEALSASLAAQLVQLGTPDRARVAEPTGRPPLWLVFVGSNLNLAEATALAGKVRRIAGAALIVQDPGMQNDSQDTSPPDEPHQDPR